MKKVRDILIEHKQGYYKPGKFESGNVHLVRISDITDEAFVDEDSTPMVKVDQDVLSNFGVQKNDFLFARTGGAGRFALVQNDIRGIFASYLIRFRFQTEFDPRFLRYYFLSDKFQIELKSTIHGGVNQNIHAENIKDCSVPVFPLPEQQRIVSVLDEAFASIAQAKSNAERNLVNARELFEAVSESIFAASNDEWEEKELRDVAELIDCLHVTPTYAKDGFPMVRATDVKSGYLDISNARKVDEKTFKEFSKKHMPKIGDVVLSRVGASYGTSALVNSNEPFCLGQNTVFLVPKINPNYFYFFLNSHNAKEQMGKLVAGAAQPTISLKSLGDLIVPVPPLAEQRAIVGRLEALSAETGRLEEIYQQKVESLEELKKSVLGKAFEGEL